MKVRLEMSLSETDLEDVGENLSKKEIKEELTTLLFEVCEEWVIHGNAPDLEFIEEVK